MVKAEKAVDCSDKNCPIHGTLSTRGRSFEGVVVSDKMKKSVTVKWPRMIKVPKFERYYKMSSKVSAHNPDCLNVKSGDRVKISECRKISKTKTFVVVEKL